MFRSERGRTRAALLLGATLALAPTAAGAAGSEAEQLREKLEATREELSATKQELSDTQRELSTTRSALDALTRRVDSLESAAPAEAAPLPAAPGAVAELPPAPAALPEAPPAPGLTARLAPVNVDNPAISFVVDTALATDTTSSWQSIGYPNGWDFTLQNGELFISAPIDPFARGYASINATSDENFDVEEAALVTTALPGNLVVKGGRFFADFGRLPHWHDEALPFVDRPPSIDRLIGGESQAEGAEIAWLAPLDQFVELTGGIYDAVGSEDLESLNENGFFGRRSFDELNFLVRPHTYFDLTDTLNAELGGSWLGVPKHNQRTLFGVDLTVRHQPGTAAFYQGLVWGTEWLWNSERFTEFDATGMAVARTRDRRQGGYSYAEAFFGRRFSGGTRFDYSEAPDLEKDLARTVSAFVTWKPSEFQRLRFQFDNTWGDEPSNQRFTLQWTGFIGSHAHGFAQR